MFKKVLGVVVVVVVGFLGFVATRSDKLHIERTQAINAPVDVVFPYVVQFQKWPQWSPWAKLDPNQKTTYAGVPGAIGSSTAWLGNDKVGEGAMTITELKPNESIGIKLEFKKPFADTNMSNFTFTNQGAAVTQVKWTMDGDLSFGEKLMGVFMDMDKMVGGQFAEGLTAMKAVAEADFAKQEEARKLAEHAAAAAEPTAPTEAPAAALPANK